LKGKHIVEKLDMIIQICINLYVRFKYMFKVLNHYFVRLSIRFGEGRVVVFGDF